MTEDPDNPPPPSEDDLKSLMGGLDFTPDWAKSEPGVKQPPMQRDHGGKGSGPRAPKKSSRGKLQGVRVKPRRESPPRGGHGPSDHEGNSGGNRHGERRGGPSRGPRPPRPPRVPVHVDFIPDKKRLSKVVAVIRHTRRVFPMKVVAEKFMENPGFLALKYTVKKPKEGDSDFELYVCRANDMVFSDRAACEAYILEHGIEEYYESQVQEVEPPKGSFPGIGRHSKSGKLIGPPNWHGYQARMDQIRQEVDPTCPPEVFARQVEIHCEEEVIEAWKKEVSHVRFYREKLTPEPEPEKPEPAPEPPAQDEEKEVATSEPAPEVEDAPVQEESPAEEASVPAEEPVPAEPEASEEVPTEEPAVEQDASQEGSVAEEVSPVTEEVLAPAEPVEDNRPYELTQEEVEKEFREKYLSKLMKTTHRAIMPGRLLERMTDPSLKSLTSFHLSRETQRPNSIIFALRPAFKHMRLKVYRFEGELMISSVEPHPIPADLKVTPEIQQILDYVAVNPHCHAKQALEAVAKQSEEVTPDLVSHFRWLIEKGHLIEFHDETLLVPPTRSNS